MSITDELREWGNRWEDAVAREVNEIANRIDAKHRMALEKVAAMANEPDETERHIKALEHLTEGMLLEESELRERVEAIEGSIEALEKRCGKIAMFSYGENDKRIKDHERRIEKLERKLNHKGER